MRRLLVVGLAAMLCLAGASCSAAGPAGSRTAPSTSTGPAYDSAAAEALWSAAVTTMGRTTAGAIPESQWAPAIRDLKPLRVYVNSLDVVVVLRESPGQESGKYIVSGLSSRMLQQGDGGFTFSPDPEAQRAARHTEVYDFTRNR